MLTHDAPRLISHIVSSVDQTDADLTVAQIKTAFGVSDLAELVHTKTADGKKNKLTAEPCSSTLAADSGNKAYAVWAGVYHYATGDRATPVAATVVKLGSGNAVIGTLTGAASDSTPDSDHRFGDTLTWTETDAYTQLRTAMGAGAAGVHNPADNTIARLTLGEIGFADFIAIESITGLKWRVQAGA